MSDLDEEEYIATRKLHGLGPIRSNGSDTNVGSIKENIIGGNLFQEGVPTPDNPKPIMCDEPFTILKKELNILNKWQKAKILYGEKIGITIYQLKELQQAIENILKEREQDKARIKELEELLKSKIGVDLSYNDYIPIQTIRDLMEECLGKYKENELFEGYKFNANGNSYLAHRIEELLENKGE